MTMTRIIGHHTGSAGIPTADDLAAYHRVIDATGVVHSGRHPISANAPGKRLAPGTYAAHTAMLNTGSIGLAMAAMFGAKWSDPKGSTDHFPTADQAAAFVREAARLCRVYGIVPTRRTVLTHAEVQITLGVQQSNKWDYDYDPFGELTSRDPIVIGDALRARISAELSDQEANGRPVTPAPVRVVLLRGSTGQAVEALQCRLSALGFDTNGLDGLFGPATYAAVVAFQKAHELLPDGIVGPATYSALNI